MPLLQGCLAAGPKSQAAKEPFNACALAENNIGPVAVFGDDAELAAFIEASMAAPLEEVITCSLVGPSGAPSARVLRTAFRQLEQALRGGGVCAVVSLNTDYPPPLLALAFLLFLGQREALAILHLTCLGLSSAVMELSPDQLAWARSFQAWIV